MGKTIIQTIGPLYGEVVNGTVFGRPNGSVYVPAQNTITLTIPDDRLYVRNAGTRVRICNSAGSVDYSNNANKYHFVAQSQDIANYVLLELAEDSDFSNMIGTLIVTAGNFNAYDNILLLSTDYVIVQDTTYYVRACLMSSSGVAVATSETFTLTGVVVE